ncbi:hypothetical protein FJ250_01690 [bacterium]|nr:hypothetical protein [bacterium]
MSRYSRGLLGLAAVLALLAGCGRELPGGAPLVSGIDGPQSDKDGSEALGPPSLAIAAGSGVSHGGVSLVGATAADLTVSVPQGAAIRQVLAYWAGGTTAVAGDDRISLDGVEVQGQLIGGPTWFYAHLGEAYRFSAYRADITALGLVQPGVNTLTVSDFSFAPSVVDENDGASVVVIWDDGTVAEIALRDGLDLAYFKFTGVLNATVPQAFAVTPAVEDRLGQLVILAASVGSDRPTRVVVTTTAGAQVFEDPMGGPEGTQWDSRELPILIPGGCAEITVEVVSTPSYAPQGASLGWVAAALAVPAVADAPWIVSGRVFTDTERDGVWAEFEPGLEGVVVDLDSDGGGLQLSVQTDAEGRYAFAVPAGAYTVSVDPDLHNGTFNNDLLTAFLPTTALARAVTVGPDSAGNNFGFEPDITRLLAELDAGAIPTDGLTLGMWTQIFRCALLAAEGGAHFDQEYGRIQRVPVYGDDCGDVLARLWYDAGTLQELLWTIEGLFLPVPYRFSDGREVVEAHKLLALNPRNLEEDVLQELLVAELNYVVGRGAVARLDFQASLVAWAESCLAWEEDGRGQKAGEKDRATQLRGALSILEKTNTGGGGGVDEK